MTSKKQIIAIFLIILIVSFALSVTAAFGNSIQLPKTGQSIPYFTDDDGTLKMGVTWPSPRHTVIGDTVEDNLTGLVWSKDANAPGPGCGPGTTKTWQGALDYVKCLNSTSYLGYTDWRLPNRKELRSLIEHNYANPALWTGHPFTGVLSSNYWTSSTGIDNSGMNAWYVSLGSGTVGLAAKGTLYYVWPVRLSVPVITGSLDIQKNGGGNGTVTSVDELINCGSTCSHQYDIGTSVTLNAAATGGSFFTGWSYAGCTGTGSCTISVGQYTTVKATFVPAGMVQLPKTGQVLSYNTDDDGALEQGVMWSSPRHTVTGDTVEDNLTGLVWSKDANVPGPGCSPAATKTWQGALDYVKCLNSSSYLGYTDWRLPNRKELRSLIDHNYANPALWTGHPFTVVQNSNYWTSSTGIDNSGPNAWYVSLGSGSAGLAAKGTLYYVWPVRLNVPVTTGSLDIQKNGGGSGTVTSVDEQISCGITCSHEYGIGTSVTLNAAAAGGSFFTGWSYAGCTGTGSCTVSVGQYTTVKATFVTAGMVQLPKTGQVLSYYTDDDGALEQGVMLPLPRHTVTGDTVEDNLTGLVWSKDANAPGPGCGPAATKTWQGALDYVKCLNSSSYLGYTDWRLPNLKELRSLIDYNYANPALWTGHPFAVVQNSNYWTSSTGIDNSGPNAWYVSLANGTAGLAAKGTLYYVWPVRLSVPVITGSLDIEKNGGGSGTVTSVDEQISCGITCSHQYDIGTSVTLNAAATGGSFFTGWSYAGCTGTGSCTVSVGQYTTVKATFVTAGMVQLPKTGQVLSYYTDDDGALEQGVMLPLQRHTVTGDTVEDNLTGLVWSKDANAPGPGCGPAATKTWQGALDYVKCLNSSSYLEYTDWRLPNLKELRSLIDYNYYNPALWTGHPFTGVQNNNYWTSSTGISANSVNAWVVSLSTGSVGLATKGTLYYVWPVRGGNGLMGYPSISSSPDPFNLGSVLPGGSVSQNITLTNTGTNVVFIGTITIAGTNANQFSIAPANDHCTGQAIVPDGSCTVDITFSPATGGDKNATISVPFNAPASPLGVPLSGNGTQYSIGTTATGSGTVTCDPNPVDHGSNSTCTVTPDTNYHITSVTIDDSGQTITDPKTFSYQYSNVTSAGHAIAATFAIDQYTVTTTAVNGSITSAIHPSVDYGSAATVTGSANTDYYFSSVSGCNGTEQINTLPSVTTFSYLTGTITGVCTVTASFSSSAQQVTVTKSGVETGRITSEPAGIDCPGVCQYSFTYNGPVVLTASEIDVCSYLNWTDSCSGNGHACNLTMDNHKGVTATFNLYPPVMISGSMATYTDLPDAYPHVQADDVVEMQTGETAIGDLDLNGLSVTLSGGFDCSYDQQNGDTTLTGNITISGGAVTVDRIAIK